MAMWCAPWPACPSPAPPTLAWTLHSRWTIAVSGLSRLLWTVRKEPPWCNGWLPMWRCSCAICCRSAKTDSVWIQRHCSPSIHGWFMPRSLATASPGPMPTGRASMSPRSLAGVHSWIPQRSLVGCRRGPDQHKATTHRHWRWWPGSWRRCVWPSALVRDRCWTSICWPRRRGRWPRTCRWHSSTGISQVAAIAVTSSPHWPTASAVATIVGLC